MFATTVLLSMLSVANPQWQTFLDANCIDCHQGPRPKGEVDLASLPLSGGTANDLRLWDRVRARLQARDMPPRADHRPDPEQYQAVLLHVERIIDTTAANHTDPGAPAARRLNRTEWHNAVLDVLGVDVDVESLLPADEIGHGFDTVGDTLSLSPPLLERYIEAAEDAAAQAMQNPDAAAFASQRIEAPDLTVTGAGKNRRGVIHMHSKATTRGTFEVPRTATYRIITHAFGRQAGDEPVRLGVDVDGDRVGTLNVPAEQSTPHSIDVTLPAGTTSVGVTFINDFYRPNHPDPSQRDRNAAVSAIEVQGPLDEPQYSRLQRDFGHTAVPKVRHAQLREFVTAVLPLLWRGLEQPGDINRIVKLACNQDGGWPAKVRAAIVTMLAHPKFLLRMEPDPMEGRTERALHNHEIATRMALLLWSSVPDGPLQRAAQAGELVTPEGRAQQLRRMLVDPRARRLAENFAPQWLQVRRVETSVPDPALFPGVDADLRRSMQQETIDTFDRLLRGGHPWTDLLNSNETVVDAALARYYGIDVPDGEPQLVQRPGPGCGVLQQAAVLLATSNPTRTSPVKRGKWVLEALLDAPPPPPPPGVDGLPRDGKPTETVSFRDLLMQHRQDPACATCHERMDELGFAMERFDAAGKPRQEVNDLGHLPGGLELNGIEGLRDWVLATNAVPRSLARHMLTYAVGRGFDATDEAAIDAVADHLRREGRLWALVEAVIESKPFLHRGAPS